MSLTKVTFSMVDGSPTNILDFGADPTGAADCSTAFQNALDAIQSAGGGTLVIPAGEYTYATGVTYDSKFGTITIVAYGATITYTGSGTGLTLTNSDGGGGTSVYRSIITGGLWFGTASGVVGIKILDCSRTHVIGAWIGKYTNGTCVELRNETSYCEQTLIDGCIFSGSTHAIVFTPQSLSGGTGGTQSFARTIVTNTILSGGVSGDYLVMMSGDVYHSTFANIFGNMSSGASVFLVNGNHLGCYIHDIGFEGGNSSSVLFAKGPDCGSNTPTLFNIAVEAPMKVTNETWSYPLRVFNSSFVIGSGTIPSSGVLRMGGGGMTRAMSPDGLRELEIARVDTPSGTNDRLVIGGFTSYPGGTLIAGGNVSISGGVTNCEKGVATSYGTTAQRPASPILSQMYFDTTINKPIWHNGSNWVDATGTSV